MQIRISQDVDFTVKSTSYWRPELTTQPTPLYKLIHRSKSLQVFFENNWLDTIYTERGGVWRTPPVVYFSLLAYVYVFVWYGYYEKSE